MDSSIKCAACLYWKGPQWDTPMDDNTTHGTCSITRALDISSKNIPDLAFIPADFDYMPLLTRPDFGCVRFGKKED